jgi:hypothetical protein
LKGLIIGVLILGLQFFFTGCELFEATKPLETTKEIPCGSPDLGKDDVSKTMVAEQQLTSTSFTINVDGSSVHAGMIYVSNICGYCQVNLKLDRCFELVDMKVWIGTDTEIGTELKDILEGNASYPDLHVVPYGNNRFGIIYPYESGWICDQNMNIVVWGKVKDICGEYCEGTVVNASLGKFDLKSYKGASNVDDNGEDQGVAYVRIEGDYMIIEYDFKANGLIIVDVDKTVAVKIVSDLSYVAETGSGDPDITKFDYNQTSPYYTLNAQKNFATFKIPLSEIQAKTSSQFTCGVTKLKVFAYANIIKHPGQQNAEYQTVWGGFHQDRFKPWIKDQYNVVARYMDCDVIPCGSNTGGGTGSGEDCIFEGYGQGSSNREFQDPPLNLDMWGWYFNFILLCD